VQAKSSLNKEGNADENFESFAMKVIERKKLERGRKG
jgi:hypothetical protein